MIQPGACARGGKGEPGKQLAQDHTFSMEDSAAPFIKWGWGWEGCAGCSSLLTPHRDIWVGLRGLRSPQRQEINPHNLTRQAQEPKVAGDRDTLPDVLTARARQTSGWVGWWLRGH